MQSFPNSSDDILAPTMAPAQVQLSRKASGLPVVQMDKRSFLPIIVAIMQRQRGVAFVNGDLLDRQIGDLPHRLAPIAAQYFLSLDRARGC
jgi:hypothetical protein